ncbi:MAG: sugar ABC transporter substrate-binding protein [Infirmifilum sp.]
MHEKRYLGALNWVTAVLIAIIVILAILLAYKFTSPPPSQAGATSTVTVTTTSAPASLAICPAHPHKKLTVYFITHGAPTDPFWIPVIEGAVYMGNLLNMTVVYEAPSTFSISALVNLMQSALAAKPDGIIISVPSGSAIQPIIEQASSMGIPVIVVNVIPPPGSQPGFPYDKILSYVGQYDYNAGVEAGKYALKWFMRNYGKAPASVVIFNHEPGHIGLTLRQTGIENALNGTGVKINVVPISLEYAQSYSIITSYLQAHPDTQLIFTLGPAGTDPAVAAVQNLGLQGKVFVMAFDIDNVTIQGIQKGIVIGAVNQQPLAQGMLPVYEMWLYLCYGITPPYNVTTGPAILDKQTISLYDVQLLATQKYLTQYLQAITR